jgi:purine nucleosidase
MCLNCLIKKITTMFCNLLLSTLLAILPQIYCYSQHRDIILDADTGNEMDDIYAIVRILLEESINVIGITSAHFNNVELVTESMWHIYPTKGINTVQISQDLNEEILTVLNRTDIPAPIGCKRMVGYAWGFYPGAPIPESPAVDFIIEKANGYSPERKLNIMCIGAVTNVASAILKAPEISRNIRLYVLAMDNDDNGNWNKNSFNALNDLNGLDIILKTTDLELFIIPDRVSRTLVFQREETIEKLSSLNHPIKELLINRWDEVSAGKTWIMWDIALVQAFIDPSMTTIKTLPAPPENGGRPVQVIIGINVNAIIQEFWNVLQKL